MIQFTKNTSNLKIFKYSFELSCEEKKIKEKEMSACALKNGTEQAMPTVHITCTRLGLVTCHGTLVPYENLQSVPLGLRLLSNGLSCLLGFCQGGTQASRMFRTSSQCGRVEDSSSQGAMYRATRRVISRGDRIMGPISFWAWAVAFVAPAQHQILATNTSH